MRSQVKVDVGLVTSVAYQIEYLAVNDRGQLPASIAWRPASRAKTCQPFKNYVVAVIGAFGCGVIWRMIGAFGSRSVHRTQVERKIVPELYVLPPVAPYLVNFMDHLAGPIEVHVLMSQ